MVKVFEGAHHEDVTVVHGNVPQVYGHAVAAAKIGVSQCRLYVCGGWEQRSDRRDARSNPVQLMVDGNQFLTLHELDISDVVQHEEEYSNLVAPRGRFEDCANRFTNSAPGPSQRVFHSLTAFTTLQEAGRPPRQELWLFGGTLDTYYPEYYFDDVWRLDIDQNPQQWQWDKVEPSGIGPTRRYGHATAQVGTNLLIHGGRALVQHQAQVANDMWILNLSGPEHWAWGQVNLVPAPSKALNTSVYFNTQLPFRNHHTMVRVHAHGTNQILLCGGHDQEGMGNEVYVVHIDKVQPSDRKSVV